MLFRSYLKNYSGELVEQIKAGMPLLFKLLAACTATDMARNLIGGTLNGIGDVDSPMLTSIFLTVAMGAGVGAALSFPAGLGLAGEFLSSAIAYLMGGLVLSKVLHSSYNTLQQHKDCDSLLTYAKRHLFCCQDSTTQGYDAELAAPLIR